MCEIPLPVRIDADVLHAAAGTVCGKYLSSTPPRGALPVEAKHMRRLRYVYEREGPVE